MAILATIPVMVGDTLPYVYLTLLNGNATGGPINVSQATVNILFETVAPNGNNGQPVNVGNNFFPNGATGASFVTIPCSFLTNGSDGNVYFNFPAGATNIAPGQYKGWIQITWPVGTITIGSTTNSTVQTQTMKDWLVFNIQPVS
ncbi:hypothetical protein [Paraburkholderia unamae]|uniref:Uncharacterized protein n=1 Tax=Paraburkholderia unamae TaxID=219649 RepID=A0ACC6RGR8_9BURK